MRPIPAHLVEDYKNWTRAALGRLAGFDWHVAADRQAAAIIAHDIKGMGASFGFPLMTILGQHMCQYLASELGESAAAAMPVFVSAMQQALDAPDMSIAEQKQLLARMPTPPGLSGQDGQAR